ncbi:hypothetical protein SAMN05660649_00552 [Desulfotomaculum arcticum]|uniref:Uncharacterized protein n=1 Tax=Desulfotruncus arcticus DSM 17038 TaxID=1121424 RepID=A0A1I2NSY6_9FIRM|nr:hypothetical protein [Desulfotruncus arcticus]SFG06848.1 hypothetical protein SAMN05660649_00552 [Desulfotomaculum arcticum] [Desulfotruncus arcticus DSM 17038]
MKVRVIDPDSPYYGQEFEGGCVYYDVYHTGDSPDLFLIKTPEGEKIILSTSIDTEHYWNQRRQEQIERLGANVGDTVIITRSGGGCFTRDFDCSKPHKITKIDSSGYVEFDGGLAKTFRPDVILVDA